MSDIELVDVTVHIDKDLDPQTRAKVEDNLRSLDGVVSVHIADETPHLAVVEYNPERLNSQDILACVTEAGGHAELVGL